MSVSLSSSGVGGVGVCGSGCVECEGESATVCASAVVVVLCAGTVGTFIVGGSGYDDVVDAGVDLGAFACALPMGWSIHVVYSLGVGRGGNQSGDCLPYGRG